MKPNSNLSFTTTTWIWLTADIKPGQPSYRYMVTATTLQVEDDGHGYAVPVETQKFDVVVDSPELDAIEELLEECGWSLDQWLVVDYWQPETDGIADAALYNQLAPPSGLPHHNRYLGGIVMIRFSQIGYAERAILCKKVFTSRSSSQDSSRALEH